MEEEVTNLNASPNTNGVTGESDSGGLVINHVALQDGNISGTVVYDDTGISLNLVKPVPRYPDERTSKPAVNIDEYDHSPRRIRTIKGNSGSNEHLHQSESSAFNKLCQMEDDDDKIHEDNPCVGMRLASSESDNDLVIRQQELQQQNRLQAEESTEKIPTLKTVEQHQQIQHSLPINTVQLSLDKSHPRSSPNAANHIRKNNVDKVRSFDDHEVEVLNNEEKEKFSATVAMPVMPILADGLSSGAELSSDDENGKEEELVEQSSTTMELMKQQISEIELEVAQTVERQKQLATAEAAESMADRQKHAELQAQAAQFYAATGVAYPGFPQQVVPQQAKPLDAKMQRELLEMVIGKSGFEEEDVHKEEVAEVNAEENIENAMRVPAVHTTDDSNKPVWVLREAQLEKVQYEGGERKEGEDMESLGEREEEEDENDRRRRQHLEEEDDTDTETDKLLGQARSDNSSQSMQRTRTKEGMIHKPAVLIEGVLFRARYLGSTQLFCEGKPTKNKRMIQAQEAVSRVKAPEGESQPMSEVDLFISTEKIMVLSTDLQQEILMDHSLRTVSYIADIGTILVVMARRHVRDPDNLDLWTRSNKILCHVFESEESQLIAQSIGQAFQVAYVEFLKANGIEDPALAREIDYQEVLNSQEIIGDELNMFASSEQQKEVAIPKLKGEILGMCIVESGWGSMLPTVVIANMQTNSASARCGNLNIGDQLMAINNFSLVGLPLSACQTRIKAARHQTCVRFKVVRTPPVVEVKIKRPDTKYQLGFSVQNGTICSLLRGGIAERGGVRVGHRIIEINQQSVVAVPHERIVHLLATSIGEIHMKTMPTSMYRLLTGQDTPVYL